VWDSGQFSSSAKSVKHTFATLTENYKYYWHVSVFDGFQWSAWMYGDGVDNGWFKLKVDTLPVVDNLKTEGRWNPDNLHTLTENFSWGYFDNDKDNQAKYWIRVGATANYTEGLPDNSVWDSGQFSSSAKSVKHTFATLTENYKYYWHVSVFDGFQWSAWKYGDGVDNGWFKLKVDTLPTVENLKAENQVNPDNLTTPTPLLSWGYFDNDKDNQTMYEIQVDNDSDFSSIFWNSTVPTSATAATYAGSNLDNDTLYYWRVKIYDSYQWSEWSSWATFRLKL